MANTNQSVEMRECLRSKENGGSGEAEAQVCSCRFTWQGTFLQSSHDNSRQHNIQIGFALQCIFLRKISRWSTSRCAPLLKQIVEDDLLWAAYRADQQKLWSPTSHPPIGMPLLLRGVCRVHIFLNQANVNVTYISSIEKCVSHELLVNPSQQSYKRRPMSEGMWTFKRRLTICLTTVGHQTCSFVERFCQVMLKPFLENACVKQLQQLFNVHLPLILLSL